MLDRKLSRWRDRRDSDRSSAARTASVMALFAGAMNIASAAFPQHGARVRALHAFSEMAPVHLTTGAFAITTAAGVGLILLAGALRRHNRLAWLLAIIFLVGSAAAHIAKDLAVEESALETFMAGYLVGQEREFRARQSAKERIGILLPIGVVGFVTLTYGYLGLMMRHRAVKEGLDFFTTVRAVAHMAIFGESDIAMRGRFAHVFPVSVAALFYTGAFIVSLRALGPALHRRTSTPITPEEALNSEDSLAWFATRDDKEVVRSEDAAIAYGNVGAVSIAAGDPLGPRKQWKPTVSAFLREVSRSGRVAAAIGVSETTARIFQNEGFIARYMGDEAVLMLDEFTIEGGAMKVARQSWNRAKRAGYTSTMVPSKDLDAQTIYQLDSISKQWRGDAAERGFSMALGRLFDKRDAESVFAIGWDKDGRVAGFLHLVPWGYNGASLDVMRRDPQGPAIFNDFLVVESALKLPELGINKLSLNFSFLRAVLAPTSGSDAGVGVITRARQNAQRWVVRKLSGPFQIESLYRFNKKFNPTWQARYFVIEAPEDAPRVLFAALRAEGLISLPKRRKRVTEPNSLPDEPDGANSRD